jgi:hypothetical protein
VSVSKRVEEVQALTEVLESLVRTSEIFWSSAPPLDDTPLRSAWLDENAAVGKCRRLVEDKLESAIRKVAHL